MAKAKKKKATNNFSKFIKWFWGLFFIGALSAALVFLMASWGVFGELPTYEHLENPETNLATEIISSDGVTLGKLYLDDNRTPIKYEDLPENLVNALVATEDARYFTHSGIDARGTLRAFMFMGQRGGASTITQQLSKLLFTERASSSTLDRVIQKSKNGL